MHINRRLESIIPRDDKNTLVLVTGARQTGKTTLAKVRYPNLRYINLDSPEEREFIRSVSSSSWGKSIGHAVIDEAQKEPLIFDKIKFAFDRKDILFQVLLGSSQILLLKKIRESLAGRISIYELWPFLMCELLQNFSREISDAPVLFEQFLSQKNISTVLKKCSEILTHLDDAPRQETEDYILKWGGMPALLPLSDDERWKWLKDYEYTYLERDLADLARLDDLEPFRKFQRLSALRSAKLLNYSEIARDAAVSVDTARRYLEYLRLSYQVILIQPYYKNLTSSVVKTPKLYWLDVGLLRQLSGFHGEVTGELYETMVVSELVKYIKTVQKQAEIYFYRTRSGLELDILLQTQAGFIGMEIKSRQQISPRDLRAMKEVAASLGPKWCGGCIVYQGDKIQKIADPDIWAVPSRRLLI